jgi:DNA-binding GntR family transcriptional regulator
MSGYHGVARAYLLSAGASRYHRVVKIDRDSIVPPYRQVANILRAQIESGEIAPGQRLPSAVALSSEYGLAVPTARKAVDLLKAEGLAVGVPGHGVFARPAG